MIRLLRGNYPQPAVCCSRSLTEAVMWSLPGKCLDANCGFSSSSVGGAVISKSQDPRGSDTNVPKEPSSRPWSGSAAPSGLGDNRNGCRMYLQGLVGDTGLHLKRGEGVGVLRCQCYLRGKSLSLMTTSSMRSFLAWRQGS